MERDLRAHIITELKRLAAENSGKAPGREAFAKATAITPAKWTGVYWIRWGDALAEAGLSANTLQKRYDSDLLIRQIALLCRELDRVPTRAELKMRHTRDRAFPGLSTVSNHFPTNSDLVAALRKLADDPDFSDLSTLLPEEVSCAASPVASFGTEGWVYLLKSGNHYKIGRSSQIEARLKSIAVALPEAATLLHAIRTDDAPGIEAYWHRRFSDRRANGEWFSLSAADVKAFLRRSFQ